MSKYIYLVIIILLLVVKYYQLDSKLFGSSMSDADSPTTEEVDERSADYSDNGTVEYCYVRMDVTYDYVPVSAGKDPKSGGIRRMTKCWLNSFKKPICECIYASDTVTVLKMRRFEYKDTLLSKETIVDRGRTSYVLYEYDDDGRCIAETTKSDSLGITHVTKFSYTDEGFIASRADFNGKGKLLVKYDAVYSNMVKNDNNKNGYSYELRWKMTPEKLPDSLRSFYYKNNEYVAYFKRLNVKTGHFDVDSFPLKDGESGCSTLYNYSKFENGDYFFYRETFHRSGILPE